jgi:hypothetical protein
MNSSLLRFSSSCLTIALNLQETYKAQIRASRNAFPVPAITRSCSMKHHGLLSFSSLTFGVKVELRDTKLPGSPALSHSGFGSGP